MTTNRAPHVLDIIETTGSYLDTKNLANLSISCRAYQGLFKKPLEQRKPETLLRHVVDANPKKVKTLLDLFDSKKNQDLVLQKTNGAERCGRKWTNISSLEAAALLGDMFMVKDLLDFVPRNLKSEAAAQLSHALEKKETSENAGYLTPYRKLIRAYEDYIDRYDDLYSAGDWQEINRLWIEGVGIAQRMLPIVGLQEICNERLFAQSPRFSEPPTREYQQCKINFNSLGVDFALYHGKYNGKISEIHMGAAFGNWSQYAQNDLLVINNLCEKRTQQLHLFIEQLLNPEMDLSEETEIDLRSAASSAWSCIIF
jgi:hypothetical protein